MAQERLAYGRLEWQEGAHPLERKKVGALGGAVLLRFEPGFADPSWCENGHAGYVIGGRLRLEFHDTLMEVDAGDAFVIDPGTRHRASNGGAVPVILFVASRGPAA